MSNTLIDKKGTDISDEIKKSNECLYEICRNCSGYLEMKCFGCPVNEASLTNINMVIEEDLKSLPVEELKKCSYKDPKIIQNVLTAKVRELEKEVDWLIENLYDDRICPPHIIYGTCSPDVIGKEGCLNCWKVSARKSVEAKK